MTAALRHTPVVAIITSNYWPEASGIGQVTTELAEFLAARGIRVRVATAMPYYPEWRIYPGYRGVPAMTERRNGVTIFRAWHYASPSPGAAGRIAHEGSLSLSAAPGIVRALRGADVAYIVSPDLTLAFVATSIARLMRKRIVAFIQDVQPEAAMDLGMVRNPKMIAVARRMARYIYASAEEILTLSEGMRRRIGEHPVARGKISILPNTIDSSELAPGAGQGGPFRASFVPSGTFAVVHAGNMGRKQDLGVVLRTARRMKGDGRAHFYVFGEGAMKEEFLAQRDAEGLTNVSHYPFQPREMLPHMLAGADAVLVTQAPEVVDIVLPLKLITAMGAGSMIVAACADGSETHRILTESGGGIVVPPSDDAALARALDSLASGVTDGNACRRAARAYAVGNFDRERVYGAMADQIIARGRD